MEFREGSFGFLVRVVKVACGKRLRHDAFGCNDMYTPHTSPVSENWMGETLHMPPITTEASNSIKIFNKPPTIAKIIPCENLHRRGKEHFLAEEGCPLLVAYCLLL